jgi:hypothetical protein
MADKNIRLISWPYTLFMYPDGRSPMGVAERYQSKFPIGFFAEYYLLMVYPDATKRGMEVKIRVGS